MDEGRAASSRVCLEPFSECGVNGAHGTGRTMNEFHGLPCQLYDADSKAEQEEGAFGIK